MARFLICSSPVHGHLAPLLRVAQNLKARGHETVVLTGSRFEGPVTATGARHVALPTECDYDDRDLDTAFPGREKKRGPSQLNFDICHIFADPLPYQYRAVKDLLRSFPAEVVLSDSAFMGVAPFVLLEQDKRPSFVVLNVLPLTISSRDTAPFGLAPSSSMLGRARNSALTALVQHVILRPGQRRVNEMLASVGSPLLPSFFMDAVVLADHLVQPTIPSFEYPRSDLPNNVRFVGPVLPPASDNFEPPSWWADLDGPRPVVHVTQGTLDTADLGRLIGPTLSALQDEDVLTVVTTGGRPTSALPGPVPANARVASFLPYDHLLPKVDAMVTNGGYGGVQGALSHGLPLVVAGASEDKPEVAARVAWAGAGINLRRGKPTPAKVRSAVLKVLSEPAYRARARELQKECSQYSAVATITTLLEELAEPKV
jgi:UDP:flavonoid glycosyltransferase YjiC (YdhE family)